MDDIKTIMSNQLTEAEVMIFLLLEDGKYSQGTLAKVLLSNQPKISRTYNDAKRKLDIQGSTLFKTDYKKPLA